MQHEHLGLFDTPPTRGEERFALAVVVTVFVSFLVVLPFSAVRLPEVIAFVPTISAIMFVGELIVATMLYAQATVFRSRALLLLASGFVVGALLLVPYALTFPGAFAPNGMLDPGINTAAWLMVSRRLVGPISIIAYVLLNRWEAAAELSEVDRSAPRVHLWVLAAAALAVAFTLLATFGHDLLPPMFANRSETIATSMVVYNLLMAAVMSAAIAMLLRRCESLLDLWLAVSLAIVLIESLLNLWVPARFTLGWYGLLLLMLVAHLFVLLALIAESNRLYVRLALSTAARQRERDERMMSMDGVAAAISHEVGQPLAAVSLSASVALNSLTRPEPNAATAIKSLRDTIEAGERATAVVKSIRSMFGRRTNPMSQFDLNELVRESASFLDREMAAQGVSLRLALDEAVPPILANRVQIQRVLVNLLTNAIESVASSPRRARRIIIRTVTADGETARVEISDSGLGLEPEALTQIFEPFFTTKASGTGLGLSLSRTIVEDHGGRLWASRGDEGGATFHLELRRAPAAAA